MQGRFERRVGLGARADFFCAGLPVWFRRLFFLCFSGTRKSGGAGARRTCVKGQGEVLSGRWCGGAIL